MLNCDRMQSGKGKKLFLAGTLFLFAFWGRLDAEGPSFLRVPGYQYPSKAQYARFKIQKGHDGGLYCSLKDTSFSYFGQAREFSFRCGGAGFSGLHLLLYSQVEDALSVRIHSEPTDAIKNYSLKQGINELLVKFNFRSGDKIFIRNESGSPFVLSCPLFFRICPRTNRELIFLISVDTLAAKHMSLYGYEKATSPCLQQFARDAVVFRRAFANSSWTVSSHMSLFSSLLEYGHAVHIKKDYGSSANEAFTLRKKTIFPLSPSIPTLTECLTKKYLTFSFNGGANVSSVFNFHRGFDVYCSNREDMNDARASLNLFARVKNHLSGFPLPRAFYFLHTYHVHAPYNPSPEFIAGGKTSQKLSKFDFYSDLGGMRNIFRPYPQEYVREVAALYDAEIAGFNNAFCDFIEFLKSNGLYDRSTIILLSDHGEEFLEHATWTHASNLYSDQIWVPLLIKFPSQEHQGKIVDAPVSLVDVLPTLAACKGLPAPGNMHGRSLMGLIAGKNEKRPPVISSLFRSKPEKFIAGKIAIIEGHLKLIYNEPFSESAAAFFRHPLPDVSTFELYDLLRDPCEKSNILESHRNDATVKKMMKELNEATRQMNRAFSEMNQGHGVSPSAELMKQFKTLGYL